MIAFPCLSYLFTGGARVTSADTRHRNSVSSVPLGLLTLLGFCCTELPGVLHSGKVHKGEKPEPSPTSFLTKAAQRQGLRLALTLGAIARNDLTHLNSN